MSPGTIEERVDRGVKYLDEYHAGWRDQINLEELHMEFCDDCVIGQALGDYFISSKIINSRTKQYMFELGFDVDYRDVDETGKTSSQVYAELEAEWRKRIEAGRLALPEGSMKL